MLCCASSSRDSQDRRDRVDETEDGYIRANTQSQYQYRCAGKSRVLAQLANRETKILQDAFEAEPGNFIALLFKPGRIVEPAPRRVQRRIGRHSVSPKLGLSLFAMEGHFFFQFTDELFPADENP
jgi:hypothetical protein